jgi:AcrR family transcriptional regulator
MSSRHRRSRASETNTLNGIATVEQSSPALRADAARNRKRIIEAAADLFAARGFEVSTAEIARQAGVGEATIFRRFPQKEDLIDAVIELRMTESLEMIAEFVADPDPERGLERFFIELLERKMQDDQGYLEAIHDRCMTNPRFQPLRVKSLDLMAALLHRVQAAGIVRDDVRPTDLSFLLMATAGTMAMPVDGLRPDLWKRYARIILDGLRPEGATKLKPPAPPRKVLERPKG